MSKRHASRTKLVSLYGVNESLPSSIPKIPNIQRAFIKSTTRIKCVAKNTDEFAHEDNPPSLLAFFNNNNNNNASRRSLLGFASFALFAQFGVQTCLVEEQQDDGFPLPGLPPIQDKIANEETGTRSFLKKGIFMADIGTKGSAYGLKKYLHLNGTVMYYDFDKVISAAPVTDKPRLTDLANRLFENFEKSIRSKSFAPETRQVSCLSQCGQLQDAVKMKDLPLTQSCHRDTTVILQEVIDRMP
ncbi:hypothetical protein Cgig2_006895 [Carnegiea gigantea]|uniref:Photosynthetic NDH subcomplex L 3 n=1 Tax=Carnegiea gigantea TaxID=171969 RepID=A0A9Q1K3R0_9CARY|nr:hypothetical protein Cgig2_006895 [Carnegiea gigantea]